ncbi:MAG: type II secretion system F family protein [Patescibacteria group bacterium]
MAQFSYKARSNDGQLTRGKLRAPTVERATALLRTHGLTPVDITPLDAGKNVLTRNVFGSPMNRKDLILFSRQLASMIQAGVPVLEALRAMEHQIDKKTFQETVRDLAYGVESGEALSQAMSKHSNVFNPFYLGVVRTGEASGRLSHALEVLANQIDQDYAFIQKVRAALIYPVFVVVVVIILSLIMLIFVLPQLTGLFSEAGVVLPWPTRLLIAVTGFFQRFWLLVILVAAALGVIARSYFKTPEGQYTFSSYLLRLPGIRTLIQKIYLARLSSVLETLFESDVPVIQSLTLARDAIGNRVYQRILVDTAKAVRDGASLSSVWQHEASIPPLLTTMVAVGERSGNVSRAFGEAARFFRRDVDAAFSSITVLIEPILIVVLGVGVGIVVAAVLLPIYNLVLVL